MQGKGQPLDPLCCTNPVLEMKIEATRVLVNAGRIKAHDLDSWLPARHRAFNVMCSKAGGCVVIGREYQPMKVAPVLRTHDPLARDSGE